MRQEKYTFTHREYQKLMEKSFDLGRKVGMEKKNTSYKQGLLLKAYEIMSDPIKFLRNI